MNDWEKWLKRKKDGLGFMTRLNAWGEPTEAEKAAALAIETNSWKESKGKKIKQSAVYSIPIYRSISDYGQNIHATRIDGQPTERRDEAIKAYIETPIDMGKEMWVEMDWWTAIKHWIKGNLIDVFYKEKK